MLLTLSVYVHRLYITWVVLEFPVIRWPCFYGFLVLANNPFRIPCFGRAGNAIVTFLTDWSHEVIFLVITGNSPLPLGQNDTAKAIMATTANAVIVTPTALHRGYNIRHSSLGGGNIIGVARSSLYLSKLPLLVYCTRGELSLFKEQHIHMC